MKVGEILEPDIQRPWFGFHALKVVLVENLPIFGVYFHRWVLSNNIRCFFFLNIQTKKTNLNEGVGKLCAGHVNVTEFSTFLMIPLKCTSSENFGFWPPMGSNFYGNIIFHWELKKNYIYVCSRNILCPNPRIQIEVLYAIFLKKNSTWRKVVETLELDKLRP